MTSHANEKSLKRNGPKRERHDNSGITKPWLDRIDYINRDIGELQRLLIHRKGQKQGLERLMDLIERHLKERPDFKMSQLSIQNVHRSIESLEQGSNRLRACLEKEAVSLRSHRARAERAETVRIQAAGDKTVLKNVIGLTMLLDEFYFYSDQHRPGATWIACPVCHNATFTSVEIEDLHERHDHSPRLLRPME